MGVCVLVTLRVLARRDQENHDLAPDIALYQAQIAAIDEGYARGELLEIEAQSARAEISRRLLALNQRQAVTLTSQSGVHGSHQRRRLAALCALILVPLLAVAFYRLNGAPHLPSDAAIFKPASPPAQEDVASLVARLERHLVERPNDAPGWDILSRVLARLGRFHEAAEAYRQAISAGGATAERLIAYGEALVAISGGIVTGDAHKAFEAAALIEPDNPRLNFLLALALEQDGKIDEASLRLATLLVTSAHNAPWRPAVREELVRLLIPRLLPDEGATEELLAQSPEARLAGLRLVLTSEKNINADDPSTWRPLILAHMILEDNAATRLVIIRVRQALAGNLTALAELEDLISRLKLSS